MSGAGNGAGVPSLGERVRRRQEQERISLGGSAHPSPCPSRVTAVLGFDEPTVIQCRDVAGHAGPHWYRISWTESGLPEAPRG